MDEEEEKYNLRQKLIIAVYVALGLALTIIVGADGNISKELQIIFFSLTVVFFFVFSKTAGMTYYYIKSRG